MRKLQLKMKNFINISDLSKNDLRAIIDGAKKRKSERGKIPNSQPDVDLPIKGKTMIMLLENHLQEQEYLLILQ